MVIDRRDRQTASESRDQDERTASSVSMRPDLVLGGSTQLPATSPAPGETGARGQAFEGDTAYLRCGVCGATITLEQRFRHDAQLTDYVLGSHESCSAPMPYRGGWGIGA